MYLYCLNILEKEVKAGSPLNLSCDESSLSTNQTSPPVLPSPSSYPSNPYTPSAADIPSPSTPCSTYSSTPLSPTPSTPFQVYSILFFV